MSKIDYLRRKMLEEAKPKRVKTASSKKATIKSFLSRLASTPDGEFWNDFSGALVVESAIDDVLQGRELGSDMFSSVSALAGENKSGALNFPVKAGTKVSFVHNIEAALTYGDLPDKGSMGVVVTVKTAEGKTTASSGFVFTVWDDGKFRSVRAEHLRLAGSLSKKAASCFRLVVSDLGDISTFFVQGSAGDELVHKATKDLWSFRKEHGNYIIERLFSETGEPLKV